MYNCYPCRSSQGSKVLQSLKESSTTDGPEGTVPNKCLKSLELVKTSQLYQSQYIGTDTISRIENETEYQGTINAHYKKVVLMQITALIV